MKTRAVVWMVLCAFLAFLLSACERGTEPHAESNDPAVGADWPAPKPDAEAEMAALWISGDFLAPEPLYQQLHTAFTALREQWSAQIPQLGQIQFGHPFISQELVVSVDTATLLRYRENKFTELDSLNKIYAGNNVDTLIDWEPGKFFMALIVVKLKSRVDLDSLAVVYSKLPGVDNVTPNWTGRTDGTNLLPFIDDNGKVSFVLIYEDEYNCAIDDRFGSCIRFWYFAAEETGYELVGDVTLGPWNLWQGPYPEWWNVAGPVYCGAPTYTINAICNAVK